MVGRLKDSFPFWECLFLAMLNFRGRKYTKSNIVLNAVFRKKKKNGTDFVRMLNQQLRTILVMVDLTSNVE